MNNIPLELIAKTVFTIYSKTKGYVSTDIGAKGSQEAWQFLKRFVNNYLDKIEEVKRPYEKGEGLRKARKNKANHDESQEEASQVKISEVLQITLDEGQEFIGKGVMDDNPDFKPGGSFYEADLRIIKSPAGSGKTDVAYSQVAKDELVIYVCHNISTTRQMAKTRNLVYYKDFFKTEYKAN